MVNETNLKRDTIRLFYNLLNTNKPSGWTVVANVPNSNSDFPCILVKPVKVERTRTAGGMGSTSDIAIRETFIELQVEIYVHNESGSAKLDEGMGNIYETLTNTTNMITLYGDNLVFLSIADSGMSDTLEINNQLYITSTSISRWKI